MFINLLSFSFLHSSFEVFFLSLIPCSKFGTGRQHHTDHSLLAIGRSAIGNTAAVQSHQSVVMSGKDPLTASMLAQAAPQDQKQMLGERLFPLIQSMYPELGSKITGMLLEIDNSELLHMLESPESLKIKVEEALAVLDVHQTKDQAAANKDFSSFTKKPVEGRTSIPLYLVDAFTNTPFAGNQAAVCLLETNKMIPASAMQQMGAEMNLSETVFVILKKGTFKDADTFEIRWFTPTTEVNLCGHATLASAAVLFFKKGNVNETINFTSRSRNLSVKRSESDRLTLNFPANPPIEKDVEGFRSLLKVCIKDESLIHSVHFNQTTRKLLVRLVDHLSRKDFESLTPEINRMIECEPSDQVRGVGLTVRGSMENGCVDKDGVVYDFMSRYFAPWLGIPEDPVTGSWHTVAACYWSKQLDKNNLYARQCSKRGGDLWVEVNNNDRVSISGNAVINLEGVFTL